MRQSGYIVFADESGDHSLDQINTQWPLFVLSFCIFEFIEYCNIVAPAIRRLKFDYFGHDLIILHERDIRKKSGSFRLLNEEKRTAFLDKLTDIIESSSMTIVSIVIDKVSHKSRYKAPEHPYHMAMKFGLERIHDFMRIKDMEGATTVVFESRGREEDRELELQFRRVCDGQNRYNKHLPFEICFASKQCNSEGLQLADLTARPLGLKFLRPKQLNRAIEVLNTKLFAGRHNCIEGNGFKVFP